MKLFVLINLSLFVLTLSFLAEPLLASSENSVAIANSILVSRDLVVVGSSLCHDNVHMYFKDSASCAKYQKPHQCSDLQLQPIRQWEVIRHPDFSTPLIRFEKMDLQFDVSLYKSMGLSADNTTHYQLEKKLYQQSVPLCDDREILEPKIVYSERMVTDTVERRVLGILATRGASIFSSPSGPVFNTTLLNDPGFDFDEARVQSQSISFQIRSPLCSELAQDPLLHLLSGEYSGNGIERVAFDSLDQYSVSLPERLDKKSESVCDEGVWL